MNRAFGILVGVAIATLALAVPRTSLAAGAAPPVSASAPILAEYGASYTMPVRTIKQIRHEIAFRTTLRQQYDFSCGSAAVATLLTFHYARPVDEARVFQAMYLSGDQARIRMQGFSLLDMKRYLEASGYKADGVRVPLDELARVGVPAIALFNDQGYRHFVVVKGKHGDRILIGDPALGGRIISREQFESLWVGGIFFVIRSHQNLARFNASADWNARLAAPIALGVSRDSLGAFSLGVPDADRF